MIQKELQRLSTGTRELRNFGLLVGGVAAVLGGWFLFRNKSWWPWFLVPGALLFVLGLIVPRSLKQVFIAWMAMAYTMGLVVSTLILSLCFLLLITPLALAGRLFGKDFLAQKIDARAKSHWLARDRSVASRPADLERQF